MAENDENENSREAALFGDLDVGADMFMNPGDDPLGGGMGDLAAQLEATLAEPTLDDGMGHNIPLDDDAHDAPQTTVEVGLHEGVQVGQGPLGSGPEDSVASYRQMLAPPSYEDSVMYDKERHKEIQPVDLGGASTSGDDGAGPSTSSRQAQDLEIKVSDPQKVADESGALKSSYTSYLVSGRTALPGFPHREFSVRRRFRDFVVLADMLAASHRGYFIPPRPDKAPATLVGSGSPEFVEQRRQDLERYLWRLAGHPVLGRAEELRTFLSFEGELPMAPGWGVLAGHAAGGVAKPAAAGDAAGGTPPSKGGGIMMRWMKDLKQSVTSEYFGAGGGGAAGAQHDMALLQEKACMGVIESHLTSTSRRAEDMVTAADKMGAAAGDLGLALVKVAKFHDAEGTRKGQYSEYGEPLRALAGSASRVGEAGVRCSRLGRAGASQSAAALGELHEYLAIMPAVRAALQGGEDAGASAASVGRDLEARRAKLALAEAGGYAKASKAEELRREVAGLEAGKEAEEEEHQRIQGRNKEELERFRAGREADMARMLASFARVQVAAAERMAALWGGVAEEMR